MALPNNPNSGEGGTLRRIADAITGTAKGIGQQVTGSAAREEAIEANRERKKQVTLLEKIEENTRGGGQEDEGEEEEKSKGLLGAIFGLFGAIKNFSVVGFVGGLFKGLFGAMGRAIMSGLSGIASFLGKGLLALGRTIFSLKFLKTFITRIFPLAAIFATLGAGIYAAFQSFMNGGTIGEIIGNFFGGMLEFITFGLIDSESVVEAVTGFFEWVGGIWESIKDTFNSAMETVSGFIDEYIVTPISDMFSYLGGLFSEYIGDPIRNAFEVIGGFLNEYLVEPITNAFSGLAEWFSGIFEPVMSFLEDFGLPEMVIFTNPITGTEYTVGPWYPFRVENSDSGTSALSSETTMSESTTENADGSVTETSSYRDYIKDVGSMTDMDGNYTADTTRIMVESENSTMNTDADGYRRGRSTEDDMMIEFDARSGVANIDGEEVDKSVYRAAKRAAETGGDVDAIRDAIAQQEAFNELSWWRRARSLASGADPRDLLAQQEGDDRDIDAIAMERVESGRALNSGEAVDVSTGEIASSREEGTNVTVVAPTTSTSNVSSSNNVAVSPSVRSQDSTMSQYQMNAAVG